MTRQALLANAAGHGRPPASSAGYRRPSMFGICRHEVQCSGSSRVYRWSDTLKPLTWRRHAARSGRPLRGAAPHLRRGEPNACQRLVAAEQGVEVVEAAGATGSMVGLFWHYYHKGGGRRRRVLQGRRSSPRPRPQPLHGVGRCRNLKGMAIRCCKGSGDSLATGRAHDQDARGLVQAANHAVLLLCSL